MEAKRPRQYSESLQIRLIKQTKTIEELVDLTQLLKALWKQGDLHFSIRVQCNIRVQQQKIIYSGREPEES